LLVTLGASTSLSTEANVGELLDHIGGKTHQTGLLAIRVLATLGETLIQFDAGAPHGLIAAPITIATSR
jgi:hypothetical protein